MLVHKTTVGSVTQVFDTDSQCFVRQDFIAGDEVSYETPEGDTLTDETSTGTTKEYLPFDMKQPREYKAEEKLQILEALLPNLYDSMPKEIAKEIQDCLDTNC